MLNTDRLCLGCMNDNGGEKVCPICGYDSSVQNPKECLPAKFWLNDRYLLGKAISKNGEGITYIGWDNEKDSIVNIREYFPSYFAVRNPDKTVLMVSGGEYTFNEGLLEFIDINKFIMQSEYPSLVPVEEVFEENGTAYAVYHSISGITLRDFLAKNGGTLKWEQARPLFLPFIDTIKGMNDNGFIHGGISIDTVIVGRDGKLRITQYAIKKLRNTGSELNALVFPGFAALEQYDVDDLQVDKYTDVYGVCATLFRVLIGIVPPEATLRVENDSMSIPSRFADELPRHVLSALANGLQVEPNDRTKNMDDFKNELVYAEVSEPTVAKKTAVKEREVVEKKPKSDKGSIKYVMISAGCTALVFVVIALVLFFTLFKKDDSDVNTSSVMNSSASSAPTVESIGSYDSNAVESVTLYSVPDLKGKYYTELKDIEDYKRFKFVIKGKEFNDKFAKGQICSQSVAAGTNVEKNTTIEIFISLGPSEVKIANILGLDLLNAKVELLKQGFLYDNIEVLEKYDEDRTPGTVIEQEPKQGTSVNTEVAIKVYVNSYTGEEDNYSADYDNSSDN